MLVVPDAHATPDFDNSRFDLLNKLIRDEQPDYLVCLGDWWDYPSYSRHEEAGSKAHRMGCALKDLNAGHDAQDRAMHGVTVERKIFTLGNHDVRPDINVSLDPRLEGTIGSKDLRLEERGWEVTGYEEIAVVEGIAISHNMPSLSGRAIGGRNVAGGVLREHMMSCIVGHSHMKDVASRVRPDGVRLTAISAGCYGHLSYGLTKNPRTSWAKATARNWWNGILILRGLDGKGQWTSEEFVTQSRLRLTYGSKTSSEKC